MSARKKLEEDFLYKGRLRLSSADFIIAWGKLVAECKHENAHWIQELHADGTFSNIIVKRCYICGVNIDEMEVESAFIEKLLKIYDKECEKKKKSLHSTNTEVKK